MKTNDFVIRATLHQLLINEHSYDNDSVVINEFGVCQGLARVDIAVVNGSINGYEIKSDKDTLERLPLQIKYYSKVFDYMSIVVGRKHLESVCKKVPGWWGVIVAAGEDDTSIELVPYREGFLNEYIDPYSVAQLIWRDEALQILEDYKLQKGFANKPRAIIWDKLAENIPLEELKNYARQCIKSRQNWRVDSLLTSCGG